MPKGTPSIKVANVQRLGAKVVLHGDDFDEAKEECARLAAAHGLAFVPPYDDPLVIAGQGTTGMEILKQLPDSDDLDGIFGAIGGGGLVAGIAEYVKRIGSPKTKIYGAETVDANAMYQSLKKGHRVTLTEVGQFSDGTAVRLVGAEPFRICQRLLDEIVLVDNDELCAGIKDIFEGTFSKVCCTTRRSDGHRRNQIDHRASGGARSCWIEAPHHRQQTDWCSAKVRCSCQWCEHEL
jgi:threonine dehydratase